MSCLRICNLNFEFQEEGFHVLIVVEIQCGGVFKFKVWFMINVLFL